MIRVAVLIAPGGIVTPANFVSVTTVVVSVLEGWTTSAAPSGPNDKLERFGSGNPTKQYKPLISAISLAWVSADCLPLSSFFR